MAAIAGQAPPAQGSEEAPMFELLSSDMVCGLADPVLTGLSEKAAAPPLPVMPGLVRPGQVTPIPVPPFGTTAPPPASVAAPGAMCAMSAADAALVGLDDMSWNPQASGMSEEVAENFAALAADPAFSSACGGGNLDLDSYAAMGVDVSSLGLDVSALGGMSPDLAASPKAAPAGPRATGAMAVPEHLNYQTAYMMALRESYPDEQTVQILNLGTATEEVQPEHLLDLFHSCGEVKRITVKVDRMTGTRLGNAFIDFADSSGAEAALALDGAELFGAQMKVVRVQRRMPVDAGWKGGAKGKCKAKWAAVMEAAYWGGGGKSGKGYGSWGSSWGGKGKWKGPY